MQDEKDWRIVFFAFKRRVDVERNGATIGYAEQLARIGDSIAMDHFTDDTPNGLEISTAEKTKRSRWERP